MELPTSDPKGASAPVGSSVPTEADQAAGSTTVSAVSTSQCAGMREVIEEKLRHGMTAQRIFQDLQIEHAVEGSYWSVPRFVKKLRIEKQQAYAF
ncbi:hypothetical protein Q31b_46890 [Novipirellula aureliae]|uniref:Uncharacterized protein n=1 Tax=Novipirellula aureliae TaxID=2527966 RepID=A0A5C6DM38_9BACT|nr:hypothetical protein [Novipirellula aureliae]TWU37900.1 hypothetical protein Q31b_46890 [Novipirellula aureliae]